MSCEGCPLIGNCGNCPVNKIGEAILTDNIITVELNPSAEVPAVDFDLLNLAETLDPASPLAMRCAGMSIDQMMSHAIEETTHEQTLPSDMQQQYAQFAKTSGQLDSFTSEPKAPSRPAATKQVDPKPTPRAVITQTVTQAESRPSPKIKVDIYKERLIELLNLTLPPSEEATQPAGHSTIVPVPEVPKAETKRPPVILAAKADPHPLSPVEARNRPIESLRPVDAPELLEVKVEVDQALPAKVVELDSRSEVDEVRPLLDEAFEGPLPVTIPELPVVTVQTREPAIEVSQPDIIVQPWLQEIETPELVQFTVQEVFASEYTYDEDVGAVEYDEILQIYALNDAQADYEVSVYAEATPVTYEEVVATTEAAIYTYDTQDTEDVLPAQAEAEEPIDSIKYTMTFTETIAEAPAMVLSYDEVLDIQEEPALVDQGSSFEEQPVKLTRLSEPTVDESPKMSEDIASPSAFWLDGEILGSFKKPIKDIASTPLSVTLALVKYVLLRLVLKPA